MITSRTVYTCSVCRLDFESATEAEQHAADMRVLLSRCEDQRAALYAVIGQDLAVFMPARFPESNEPEMVLTGRRSVRAVAVVEVGFGGLHYWALRVDPGVPAGADVCWVRIGDVVIPSEVSPGRLVLPCMGTDYMWNLQIERQIREWEQETQK